MKVDFFIVGAPKAGTTSLYHYLNEHLEIEMSSQKEPDYFSDEALKRQGMYYGKNRIDNLEKYHGLFTNKDVKLRGEASVSYLFYDDVPQKIKEYNSKAKIIIMLRNPIDRAFSHYLMDYRLGLVSDSFDSIIKKKLKHKNANLFFQQYIKLSEYSQQVSRYLEVFDKEKIMFIDYEDFKNDVSAVVDKAYLFLGVNNDFQPNLKKKHNTYTMPKNSIIRFIYSFVSFRKFLTNIVPKSIVKWIRNLLFKSDKKPTLSNDTRKFLASYFKDDVDYLSVLLKKKLFKVDKIGLVTITYNSAEVLKPFLDCVWAQTHKNIILYVVDNSSKDSTLKILSAESDNRLVLIENDNNYGVAKANNQGILKAIEDECDQVLIINNDVEFETTLIEKLLNAQQENHCSLISPKMMYFDDLNIFGMLVVGLISEKVFCLYTEV